MDTKPDVQLWKADQLEYVKVGSGDMTFSNPIAPPIGTYHAGYLNFKGGVLEWTEHGDELIWVLDGQVQITHGADVYDLDPGDLIFLKDGLSLRMSGTNDARIAYISTLNCQ